MSNPGVRLYNQALKCASDDGADLARAALLLEKARALGNATASYALATWYLFGRHFKKDLPRAVDLLKEAVERGSRDALYDLAVCYATGAGVTQNDHEAFQLYLKAAIRGDEQSFKQVGRCYWHGTGVLKDEVVAEIWLSRADEVNVSNAA
jgi:uncharacterized protein